MLKLGIERAKFLFEKAMEEDSQGNAGEAFKMYQEAAELCLKLVTATFCFVT
jgi:MIT (microtubule interacting and transport) domain